MRIFILQGKGTAQSGCQVSTVDRGGVRVQACPALYILPHSSCCQRPQAHSRAQTIGGRQAVGRTHWASSLASGTLSTVSTVVRPALKPLFLFLAHQQRPAMLWQAGPLHQAHPPPLLRSFTVPTAPSSELGTLILTLLFANCL